MKSHKKRVLSKSARAKISAAQKARWAKHKNGKAAAAAHTTHLNADENGDGTSTVLNLAEAVMKESLRYLDVAERLQGAARLLREVA